MSRTFLMKCHITAVVVNKASQEERVSFEAAFELDEAGVEIPWYVLRNHIAPAFLTEKLGREGIGWKRVYECKIVKIINASDPSDIELIPMRVMTFDQLKTYVDRWDLNVNVDEFHSISIARQFVQLMEEDPTAYPKHLAEYRDSRQTAYPEVDKYRKDVKTLSKDVLSRFNDIDTNIVTPKPDNATQTKFDPKDDTSQKSVQSPSKPKPSPSRAKPKPKQTRQRPKVQSAQSKFPPAVPMKQVVFPDEKVSDNGPFAKL